jgi:hypothetical protein
MQELNGPIPGQSLTTEPKNFPWERPPEIVDPEEAIQMHIVRLSDPEMLGDVLDILEFEEIDIQTLVVGMMRGAVANGIHSIDVGMMVAPVVHEFIKQAAKAAGIDAEDGFEDKEAKKEKEQYRINSRARKMLKEMGAKPKEVVKEIEMEESSEEGEEGISVAPRGLMARGDM